MVCQDKDAYFTLEQTPKWEVELFMMVGTDIWKHVNYREVAVQSMPYMHV